MICRSKQSKIHFTAYRGHKKLLCAVFFILIFQSVTALSQNTSLISDKNLLISDKNKFLSEEKSALTPPAERILQSRTVNSTYAGLTLITQSIILKKYDVNVRDMRIRFLNKFSYDYDTYLQFVPVSLTFALKGFGLQSRSSWGELTTAALLSYGFGYGLAKLMKENISELRPDWGGFKSFPSGHTTIAFVGASILSKEFKENYPYLSIAGYTMASVTGLSRIANNRHWTHDVLFGAGLGILATEFSYALTDLIFNKSYSPAFPNDDAENGEEKPNFANLFFTYNITNFDNPQRLNNNTEYSIRNGIGIGVEAAYFPHKNIGVDIRVKADSYIVDNGNIWWPEDSVMVIKSVEIAPVFSYPVFPCVDLGLRCGVGLNHLDKNQLQEDVPIKSQNNLQLSGGMFLNLRMEKHTYLRLFADYTHTNINIENKMQRFQTLCLGAVIALHF